MPCGSSRSSLTGKHCLFFIYQLFPHDTGKEQTHSSSQTTGCRIHMNNAENGRCRKKGYSRRTAFHKKQHLQ